MPCQPWRRHLPHCLLLVYEGQMRGVGGSCNGCSRQGGLCCDFWSEAHMTLHRRQLLISAKANNSDTLLRLPILLAQVPIDLALLLCF